TPQGTFSSLVGVAVDQSGNLWTIDAGTANIDVFNAKGKFVRQWNDTHGSPTAIAVDSAHNAVYLITQSTTERWSLTGDYQVQVDPRSSSGQKGSLAPPPRRSHSIRAPGTCTSTTPEIRAPS